MAQTNMAKAKQAPTPEEQATRERRDMLRRAQDGDESTREGVRALVRGCGPDGFSPLKERPVNILLSKIAGKNILFEEDAKYQMRALHRRLAGENPTPLEALLVERIVACWLHLHYCEMQRNSNLTGVSFRQADHNERLIDGAQRRYLSAVKALAQVRKLALPAVMVNIAGSQNIGQHQNIAERQVNVVVPAGGPED